MARPRLRRRPSASMIVAMLAVIIAATGVGNAASKLITGKNIKDGSVTGKDIKDGSLAGTDVKDGSLTGADIKNGSVATSKLTGKLPGDKFIALDIVNPGGGKATWSTGYGSSGGLSFADAQNQDGSWNIVLPPTFTAGSTITIKFTWHTPATACGVAWRANYISVSRAGSLDPTGGVITGMTEPGPGLAGATANMVQSATFTLTSPTPSTFTLKAGDSISFGLYRSGTDASDTCAAAALMDSMVATYA